MKKLFPIFIMLLMLVSCGKSEHTCDFSDWHALVPSTCAAEGQEYRSCSCGNTESRPLVLLPHDVISVDAKPVSCTEPGYAAFEYCNNCSYTTFGGEISPAHDIATVAAKAPTCTDVGHEAYEYCKRCENYTTYTEISATGHTFSTLECEKCNTILTAVAIPEETATLTEGITASYYVTDGGLSLLDIQGAGDMPDFSASPFSGIAPTHLRIGDGITAIGENTFAGMSSIISVTVGSSVTNIGYGAFVGCYRITEVINKSALPIFYDSINGEIGRYASYITAETETRVKFIGDFVFYIDGKNYTLVSYIGTSEHIILPILDEVDTYVVRNYAFYDLDFLLSVEYGDHVIYVGPYAFDGCDNLAVK